MVQLNAYVEEQQEQTNNEVAVQIEAINDALDQLRDIKVRPHKTIGLKTQKNKQ